ncbi:MAG: hypothetical protein NT105_12460 [Verrucomicrobia bacterium]|nr:hypothetical protein [Verrucomicrobiota bacterium]
MRKSCKTIVVLGFSLLVLLSAGTVAFAQDEKSIQGRMELETHDDYFKARVFLTNKTDHDITIATGRGGQRRSVTPFFSYNYQSLQASKWVGPGRRSNRPDPLTLKPGVEILYDTYIIPPIWRSLYPDEGKSFEGFIHFQGLDKQDPDKPAYADYSVRFGFHKLPSPPPKPAAGKKE